MRKLLLGLATFAVLAASIPVAMAQVPPRHHHHRVHHHPHHHHHVVPHS
ncbi:MAG TPA: hypothetical protein VGV37_17630 [Aliidongia sp.]|nr:hypothetical protein [Aliidongia sp.]HEV2676351.1 hypothetical protein [Aliidongia sp.]